MKNNFCFILKARSVLKIFSKLDKKAKANFKIYDVTD